MNYVLSISLEGAEKAAAGVEEITKKVSQFRLSTMTSLKISVADISKAFDAAAKSSDQFNKNLNKVLSFSAKTFKESFGDFASGKKPVVSIAQPTSTGIDPQAELQKAVASFGKGGLATSGQALPKTAEEMAQDKAASIKREAMEARRKDLMEADAKKATNDRARFYKDMTFLMMPAMNPGSLWATLFSTRQAYSALMTEHGQKELGKFGLGGIGGAMKATAALVSITTAVGFALMALKKAVSETIAAYERARMLYAKALTGGMGLEFTTRRSMLAQIMGVSEQDVFRFGAQMAYLNPKLDQATKILARTAVPLTQVSWEFKVLGQDFQALFSLLALQAKPAVMDFISSLDQLVKFLTKHSKELGIAIRTSYAIATLGISEYNRWFFGKTGKKPGDEMPNPQAWMKQLPASHWEKMGLITMGGQQNYQKDIAKNTREMAVAMKQFLARTTDKGNRTWGMSPVAAQP